MSAELALATLEQRVLVEGAIAAYLKRVDTLRKLTALEDEAAVRGLVLAMQSPVVEAQALAAVLDAYGVGANDALDIVEAMGLEDIARIGRPSAEAKAAVAGLDKLGQDALIKAQLSRAGADLAAVTAPLFGHADAIGRRVTYGVNKGGNEGSTAVAKAAELPLVWVAETNACVHCLAYSGRVVKAGDDFPAGLTYGKHSPFTDPLSAPPLHPRCRCTVEPLRAQDYASALRREADRSVLRGFSLQSESMGVRVDAAERLLGRGVVAPKSVIAYAQSAVKRGSFTKRAPSDPHELEG